MEQLVITLFGEFIKGSLMLKAIFGALGGIYLLFKSLRFVKEGSLGLKLRFGKVVRHKIGAHAGEPKVIHPGWCWLIPHVDTLIRHPVRQQTISLKDQKMILKDNSIWIVSAVVIFRIVDIYKALFEISDVDDGIRNVAAGKLREVLQHLDSAEDLKDIAEVSRKLMEAMSKEGDSWGIKMIGFSLVDCAPDASTAGFISAKAKVKMNIAALKEAGIDPHKEPMLAAIVLGGIQLVSSVKENTGDAPRSRTLHDGMNGSMDSFT